VPTKKPVALNLRRMLEEKLLSSGISAKDGAAMKCDVRSADNAPSDIPIKEAGFIIPYFDIHGKPLKFWRYRYLIEPKPKGFAALTKRKPLKYVQPPKSEVRMYLPPILDWAALAKDSSETIIITEGELKAFSACANTPYACIGLGGVWSFKSNSRHEPVIPDFDAFKWEGRPVYIVYDSDAVTNPNVMMAENALARVLLSRGAEPHIVRLPALADGAKCGLDDYLVAHGAERLEDLLEKCETWRSAKELHKLNEEVVYVTTCRSSARARSLTTRSRPASTTKRSWSRRTSSSFPRARPRSGSRGHRAPKCRRCPTNQDRSESTPKATSTSGRDGDASPFPAT
jgi:hypothetical protein